VSLGTVLKTVAPWIATALGGPLGGLAVDAAASALGLSDKTAEKVKLAIGGATPEQLLALKAADQAFAVKMRELGFMELKELEALAVADRKDARAMQVQLRSLVPAVLTWLILTTFATVLAALFLRDIPISNREIIVYMVGQLSGFAGSAVAFWLGTTRDSGNKTALLAQKREAP